MIATMARHPTAGNLLMLVLLALGGFTLIDLRRESTPQIAPNQVEVSVLYPGASAIEVEEAICRPLEEAMDGIANLDEVRSEALEGRAVVTLEMLEGSDFDVFRTDVDAEVNAIDTLPTDAEEPVVEALGLRQKVLSVLVSGSSEERALKAYCEELKGRLRRLPEVSLVEVVGFADHQLRVELRAEALARFELGPADVALAIEAQSVDVPAGTIETRDRDLLVRFTERRRTPAELEDVVIRAGEGGAEIRVGEVGRVVDLFEDSWDQVVVRGQRAGRLEIEKTLSEDSLEIADAVVACIDEERQRLPPGIELTITENSSFNLRGQISMVVTNGWQGMVLVALSLWLFFSLRLAFWVVMGLPVSIIGACALMPGCELSINMLTLVGFLLALGLLMDDAIVIAENIAAHRARGKSAMAAAIDGTNEVKVGVFASFLTTVCVLGPLSLIAGNMGQTLRVIPLALILVMAVSLIEAFWILPGHLGHALHGTPAPNAFRRWFERGLDFVRERLIGRTVDWAIRVRYLFVATLVGALIACIGLFVGGRIPFQAMPELEGDAIVARILLPQGSPLARTEAVVAQVLGGLAEMDRQWTAQQTDQRALVQASNVRFGKNKDAYESGAHVATVTADLLTAEERTGRVDDYLRAWREAAGTTPDALEVVYTTPALGAAGQPIEVRVSGDDLDELLVAADEIRSWIARFEGVGTLLGDLRPGKPEARLELLEGTRGLGFDARGIANQVAAAFRGQTADELQLGPEAYEVDVRLAAFERDSLEDLERLRIPLASGGDAPLSALASIELDQGWARIARIDGIRTVTVRGDVDTTRGNTSAILGALRRDFLPQWRERYPNLGVALEGEAGETSETQQSMVRNMLLGLLGVFVLLSFQFRSYMEPLVVMAAIPLSLVGVILGHVLLDFPFTLPSMLGFISLAGVVVNDSILLVEFIKIERRAGRATLMAAAQASRARFRAVLLTSSTTIAGLLPLLAETSLQAQIVKGLVISVSFGLMASTILVLYAVPCLYAILADLGCTNDDGLEAEAA